MGLSKNGEDQKTPIDGHDILGKVLINGVQVTLKDSSEKVLSEAKWGHASRAVAVLTVTSAKGVSRKLGYPKLKLKPLFSALNVINLGSFCGPPFSET